MGYICICNRFVKSWSSYINWCTTINIFTTCTWFIWFLQIMSTFNFSIKWVWSKVSNKFDIHSSEVFISKRVRITLVIEVSSVLAMRVMMNYWNVPHTHINISTYQHEYRKVSRPSRWEDWFSSVPFHNTRPHQIIVDKSVRWSQKMKTQRVSASTLTNFMDMIRKCDVHEKQIINLLKAHCTSRQTSTTSVFFSCRQLSLSTFPWHDSLRYCDRFNQGARSHRVHVCHQIRSI